MVSYKRVILLLSQLTEVPWVEWECEFWGERITGGGPLTGLDPFPPWNYKMKREDK